MAEVIQGVPDSIENHWPGALQGDPTALRRFSFYALRHQISEDPDWIRPIATEGDALIEEELISRVLEVRKSDRLQGLSRLEASELVAQSAGAIISLVSTLEVIRSAEPEEAIQATAALLDSQPIYSSVMHRSSPLFPNGRASNARVTSKDFVAGTHRWNRDDLVLKDELGDIELPEALTDVIRGKLNNKLEERSFVAAANEIEPINPNRLEELRQAYGTKAANLIAFKEAVAKLPMKGEEDFASSYVKIPEFVPVLTNTYELWKIHPDTLVHKVERLRQEVLESVVPNSPHAVVAIRSSAVNSEDGKDVSGAGIYESVAADPRDPEAFLNAIEQVYASVDSELAVAYRKRFGIEDESMGLLIQRYIDSGNGLFGHRDIPYGTIDTMTNDNKLAKGEFQSGTLLYDRQHIFDRLLVGASMMEVGEFLHTIPDHSAQNQLRDDARNSLNALHAALFAEKVFGTPVQVECAGENVLQVRPLPAEAYAEPENEIVFPEDREPLFETRAVGTGDMYLKVLNEYSSNIGKTGLAVFGTEHAFTVHGSESAFPDSGAVLILHNDGRSGHVQMRTIERGLMCLFSEVGHTLNLKFNHNDSRQKAKYVRVISDGYKGAVYELTDAELAEVSGKKELLQRVANSVLGLIEAEEGVTGV